MGHSSFDLGAGGIACNAQLGGVGQALFHRQLFVHNVFLRHIAQHGIKGIAVAAGVNTVKADAAGGAGRRPGDAAQQTRFAGSGTAHHNHKAVGFHPHASAVHNVQRLAGVAVFDGFIHIQQFNADAHLMLMVVQHSAGKCKHLGGHIDDSAVRQQLIAHAGAVQVSTVGGAKVIQFIVAVLIHHLAVVAGNTVAGQLHIAVLAAADQDAALAAHIQLPQHGGVGRFPPQGGGTLALADFLHAEGDFLCGFVAVGIQADHIPRLQGHFLTGMDIAVIVPGAAGRGACVLHQPGIVFVFDCELVFPHVVAAQHKAAIAPTAKHKGSCRAGKGQLLAVAPLADG